MGSGRPADKAVLGYRSSGAVTATIEDKLTREIAELNQRHDWWAGALEVRSTGPGGHLAGLTELTMGGYETSQGERIAVDEEDDAFMAWMDLCVIVDWLCERSGEHRFDWSLTFAGEQVGCIERGEEDEDLAIFIAELGSVVGASFDERDDERARRLDEQHIARLA